MFAAKHKQRYSFLKAGGILLALLLTVVACASRPDESAETRTLTPTEAIDVGRLESAASEGDQPSPADADGVHTILALSAGGADGAFGAGVLAGWTAHGSRPEFDVVTGVSTGALLAVLAFLGPEYDSIIERLYTTQTNETIFRKLGLGGLFGDSLYDNSPFQAQIESVVTEDLLRKIAAEHAKGRRLYVATTNLDAGASVIWDMGRIAQGGRTNPLQHFQKVLRASAAVPGLFKPVYIKPQRGVQLRQAHVDGGVKEPVLYANFMARSTAPEKQLFLVINGTARRFNASTPVKPTLAGIAQKTISEMLRELERETIFRHYVEVQNSGVGFNMIAIPDSIPIAQRSLNFDPARMRRLYDAGYALGRQGTAVWQNEPPSNRSPAHQPVSAEF